MPKIALPARTGNDLSVMAELVSLKTNLVTSIHNVFSIARVIKELEFPPPFQGKPMTTEKRPFCNTHWFCGHCRQCRSWE